MQYLGDTALQKAIYAADRRVRFEFWVDWNRNGLYDHPYSDLSDLYISGQRSGSINSDLPEQVNVITGTAASDVRIVLGGKRKYSELRAIDIFSPFEFDSPIYGKQIEGTPCKYIRTVYSSAGPKTVRQFTGKIREYKPAQASSTVQVLCQDNLDVSGAPCTLPLWAVGTASPYFNFFWTDPAVGRPVSTTWVVEEICRQAGYHTGPLPRPGCLSYQTCNGAFFPSFGYGNMTQGTNVDKYPHFLSYDPTVPFAKIGPYGIAPQRQNVGVHKAYFNTNDYVYVPQNGTGNGPVNLVYSQYVHFRTSAGASSKSTTSTFWLDDAPAIDGGGSGNYGRCSVIAYEDGDIRLNCTEGWLADAVTYKTWYAQWQRTALQLPDGPHYISALFKFRNNDVDFELWIDGVNVGAPNNGADSLSGLGFRHGTNSPNRVSNPVSFTTSIPVQHCQWSVGFTTGYPAFTAGEQLPPLGADGLVKAIVGESVNEMAWIPDIVDGDCWEVLKDLANAEFGATFFNEYGQLIWMSHKELRELTQFDQDNAIIMSDDQLNDFVINPSVDQYRNSISASWTFRYSQEDIVWRNQNAKDFIIGAGQTSPVVDMPLTEVIAIDESVYAINYIAPAEQDIPIYNTQVAAVTYANPDVAANSGWVIGVFPRRNQRTVGLIWGAGSTGQDLYIGAFKGANQPAFLISGRKYSQPQIVRKTTQDTASIATNGGRVRGISLPDNKWRQTEDGIDAICAELLSDMVVPAPAVEDVEIVGDPRIQYVDVIALTNKRGVTGKVFAQVLGRGFDDSVQGGMKDRLTLRLIKTPNNWILGDPDLSILGDTTVL